MLNFKSDYNFKEMLIFEDEREGFKAYYRLFDNYAMFQLNINGPDNWSYLHYYVVPKDRTTCTAFIFLPKLNMLLNRTKDKRDLNFFSWFNFSLATLIDNTENKDPSNRFVCKLSYIKDFSESIKIEEKIWCISIDIPLTFSNRIIQRGSDEKKCFGEYLYKLFKCAMEFEEKYDWMVSSKKYVEWIKSVNSFAVLSAIKKGEKDKLDRMWGRFINTVNGFPDNYRDYINKTKMVIVSGDMYPIGETIKEEHQNKDAFIIILAELIIPSLEGSGKAFVIELDNENGYWIPKVDLGSLIEGTSILLDHINTKAWKKIDEVAHKMMPVASEIWFLSNPEHKGANLERFLQYDDKTRSSYHVDSFEASEPDYLKGGAWCRLNQENPWSDFKYLADIINTSCSIITEYSRYHPIWVKDVWVHVAKKFGKGMLIGLNPLGYVIRKGYKHLKKNYFDD